MNFRSLLRKPAPHPSLQTLTASSSVQLVPGHTPKRGRPGIATSDLGHVHVTWLLTSVMVDSSTGLQVSDLGSGLGDPDALHLTMKPCPRVVGGVKFQCCWPLEGLCISSLHLCLPSVQMGAAFLLLPLENTRAGPHGPSFTFRSLGVDFI